MSDPVRSRSLLLPVRAAEGQVYDQDLPPRTSAPTALCKWLQKEYTVFPDPGSMPIIEKHPDLPWTSYLGAAAMPSQTVFVPWKEHSNAKPSYPFTMFIIEQGEITIVTADSGVVDACRCRMVIPLAKEAGCKVSASAGSEDKIKFMQSIGADVMLNYKTTDTRGVLKKEKPIDITGHSAVTLAYSEFKYTEEVTKGLDKVGM
ncbi:hypothetical protein B0H14DRAFT_2624083 [Mycena olivaceomarginata]|nr:hypothetical protein B0H14DRAFT_2624083 [Mycena olivaceomarginata]